jgi:hypothetical protein
MEYDTETIYTVDAYDTGNRLVYTRTFRNYLSTEGLELAILASIREFSDAGYYPFVSMVKL